MFKRVKLTYWFSILVGVYQVYFSLYFGGACRFYPSCSEYARQAFLKCPTSKEALFLILKRLFKCHFVGTCGLDPLQRACNKE